ncbi:SagB/ThcOx family dehydrogenase [Methanosarcina sp. KYL-1]|uniref:SagB/ThcOx family dehydrogenase n=1 Tax=Methanosarcina sp. KYL-1 TaxID=2602068 RepID=UPI002100D9C8|nr:SagB/ThcOx family dehydrogenase [Methanosarcina sp. KYL-1]MCQ1535711.1 SagB/ThcOx family dehydrogenase [Methanosarcina sp. KYL-1]
MGNQGITDLPMKIKLPEPKVAGKSMMEGILAKRRSVRNYSQRELSEPIISRFLWAAQGISSEEEFRTAPSAGALYPLEVHVVVGEVSGLEPGVYRYISEENALIRETSGDLRKKLAEAALSQLMIRNAPASLVITAVYPRITSKYGKRGIRYAYMEAGHASQNVYLLATELGIGTCAIGAFEDEEVRKVLKLPVNEEPLYIMPLGHLY